MNLSSIISVCVASATLQLLHGLSQEPTMDLRSFKRIVGVLVGITTSTTVLGTQSKLSNSACNRGMGPDFRSNKIKPANLNMQKGSMAQEGGVEFVHV